MAAPRVFISSTFYDLRYIRDDLERLIKEIGYEPIRHETGSIPYSKEVPLEESAYREVTLSDIIVCIIGGRYGSDSSTRDGSITQNELKQALDNRIQVYVFVEQNVYSEFSTYQINKENKDIKYRYVDNVAVFEFLETIFALPQNNPIQPFSTSFDIFDFLKSQWAGLFQRFLQEERRLSEIQVLEEMTSVASTLKDLVNFLTAERRNKDEAIQSILLANHPAFRAFAKATDTKYRVYFTTMGELNSWLSARSFKQTDDPAELDSDSVAEWMHRDNEKYIKLTHEIFDKKGHLLTIKESEWSDKWLQVKSIDIPLEDDIPF